MGPAGIMGDHAWDHGAGSWGQPLINGNLVILQLPVKTGRI